MTIEFLGYHGTDHALIDKIDKEGFIPSTGDEEWLGSGVYFYVNGICDNPQDQAKSWGILQAWDKESKKCKYNLYAVIKAVISVDQDNFLDLNTSKGQELFNYIKRCCIAKLRKNKRKLNYVDGIIINFAHDKMPELGIEVVKCDMFIKLTKEDRVHHFNSRIPNCSICAVYEPSNNIKKVELIEFGKVQ